MDQGVILETKKPRFKLGMRILNFLVAIIFFFQVTGVSYVLAEDSGYWGDGTDTGEGGYEELPDVNEENHDYLVGIEAGSQPGGWSSEQVKYGVTDNWVGGGSTESTSTADTQIATQDTVTIPHPEIGYDLGKFLQEVPGLAKSAEATIKEINAPSPVPSPSDEISPEYASNMDRFGPASPDANLIVPSVPTGRDIPGYDAAEAATARAIAAAQAEAAAQDRASREAATAATPPAPTQPAAPLPQTAEDWEILLAGGTPGSTPQPATPKPEPKPEPTAEEIAFEEWLGKGGENPYEKGLVPPLESADEGWRPHTPEPTAEEIAFEEWLGKGEALRQLTEAPVTPPTETPTSADDAIERLIDMESGIPPAARIGEQPTAPPAETPTVPVTPPSRINPSGFGGAEAGEAQPAAQPVSEELTAAEEELLQASIDELSDVYGEFWPEIFLQDLHEPNDSDPSRNRVYNALAEEALNRWYLGFGEDDLTGAQPELSAQSAATQSAAAQPAAIPPATAPSIPEPELSPGMGRRGSSMEQAYTSTPAQPVSEELTAAAAPAELRPAVGVPPEPAQPSPTAERLRQEFDQPVGAPPGGAAIPSEPRPLGVPLEPKTTTPLPSPEGARGPSPTPGPQPGVEVTPQPPAGNEDLMRSLREAQELGRMVDELRGEMPPLLRPEGQPLQAPLGEVVPGGVGQRVAIPITPGATTPGAESRFGPPKELHPSVEARHRADLAAREFATGIHAQAAQPYYQPYGGYGYGGYAGPQYNQAELGRAVQGIRGIGKSEADYLRRLYPYQPSESTRLQEAGRGVVERFVNSLPVQVRDSRELELIDTTTTERLNNLRSRAADPAVRPIIESSLRTRLGLNDSAINQLLGPSSGPGVSSEPPSSDFYIDPNTGLQGPAYLPNEMKVAGPSIRTQNEPLDVDAARRLLVETIFSRQPEGAQRAITGAEREQQKKNLWQGEDRIIQRLQDKYGNRWTDAAIPELKELARTDPALAARVARRVDVEIGSESFSPTPDRYNYTPEIVQRLYPSPAGQAPADASAYSPAASPVTSAATAQVPLREASLYDVHEANVRNQVRRMMDELAGAAPGRIPTYPSFEKFKEGIDDLLSSNDKRAGRRSVDFTSRIAREEAAAYAEVIRQRDRERPIWGRTEIPLNQDVLMARERNALRNFQDAVGLTNPETRLGLPIAPDVMETLPKQMQTDIQAELRRGGREVTMSLGREAMQAEQERRTEERRTAEALRNQQDLERSAANPSAASAVNPLSSPVVASTGAFGGDPVVDEPRAAAAAAAPVAAAPAAAAAYNGPLPHAWSQPNQYGYQRADGGQGQVDLYYFNRMIQKLEKDDPEAYNKIRDYYAQNPDLYQHLPVSTRTHLNLQLPEDYKPKTKYEDLYVDNATVHRVGRPYHRKFIEQDGKYDVPYVW
jgi:hypothetical protein